MAASSEELVAQVAFIRELAPYYRVMKDQDGVFDFLGRLFDLWFIRWRLKLQDYGGSIKSLNDGKRQKIEWVMGGLEVAASMLPEGTGTRWSPGSFMTICERRQGIAAKRKYCTQEEDEDARPRPWPRPKAKKARRSDGDDRTNSALM